MVGVWPLWRSSVRVKWYCVTCALRASEGGGTAEGHTHLTRLRGSVLPQRISQKHRGPRLCTLDWGAKARNPSLVVQGLARPGTSFPPFFRCRAQLEFEACRRRFRRLPELLLEALRLRLRLLRRAPLLLRLLSRLRLFRLRRLGLLLLLLLLELLLRFPRFSSREWPRRPRRPREALLLRLLRSRCFAVDSLSLCLSLSRSLSRSFSLSRSLSLSLSFSMSRFRSRSPSLLSFKSLGTLSLALASSFSFGALSWVSFSFSWGRACCSAKRGRKTQR